MFARRLEKLADSVEDLCQELAEETLVLIQHGFDTATAPNGTPWAPRRGKRTNPILVDTGRLESSFVIAGVNKNGFGITSDTEYGGFHQHGTVNLPARKMVPAVGETLGTWAEPIQKIARQWFKANL
jgi:phage gpG-like protein